jgi:hypothetical protein
MRWLIEDGFVRRAAELRENGSVIVGICQLEEGEKMHVFSYSIFPRFCVKFERRCISLF